MKTIALITAAFVACASCAKAEDKPEPNSSSSSVSVTSNSKDGKGKAVVVIDVNGKKETREIELPADGRATLTLDKIIQRGEAPHLERLDVINKIGTRDSGPVTFLGVSTAPIAEAVAGQLPIDKGTGLLVETVLPDSPAAQAGLQKNDVLVRFDDQILINPEQLSVLVHTKKTGDEGKLTYFRKGQQTIASAKLTSKDWQAEGSAATLDVNGGTLKAEQLIESIAQGGSPLSVIKRAMWVDSDGHVIVSDVAKNLESIAAELENTLKNKVAPDVMEAVKKALDQAKQAVEDGAKKNETAEPKK